MPLDKIHQTWEKKIYPKVLTPEQHGATVTLSNTNGMPSVIRTVINLGKWFRAEPCQKQGGGQKGFPQTPFPKTHNSKFSWFTYCSRFTTYGVELERVMNDYLKRITYLGKNLKDLYQEDCQKSFNKYSY